jgi:hypothetical protein
MRTLVFAPSGARVWNVLILRFIGQLNWIGVHSSGITLLPQSGTSDLDQRAASRAGLPEPRLRKSQDRFATAPLKPGDCFS